MPLCTLSLSDAKRSDKSAVGEHGACWAMCVTASTFSWLEKPQQKGSTHLWRQRAEHFVNFDQYVIVSKELQPSF